MGAAKFYRPKRDKGVCVESGCKLPCGKKKHGKGYGVRCLDHALLHAEYERKRKYGTVS